MQGFSLALLEDYGDRLDEAGRRYAERVITAARTMDRLIDDLLAYSRLARAELRLVPIDLGRLVRSSLEQLDGEVRGRGARITVADPLPSDPRPAASHLAIELLERRAHQTAEIDRHETQLGPREATVRQQIVDQAVHRPGGGDHALRIAPAGLVEP